MSVATELIDRARDAGLRLIDLGDKLQVRGPLPAELGEALRESKAEILEQLRGQPRK